MNYWLFKSEPNCYSIDDLARDKTEHWDGIRNYQARNFMRDQCQVGDQIIFYHSSCAEPGAVGICEVSREAYPDHTAWDPASDHPDPKSTRDNPRWLMVDVTFKAKFKTTVSLKDMRSIPALSEMQLLKKGNRLSLFPITKSEFELIQNLGL